MPRVSYTRVGGGSSVTPDGNLLLAIDSEGEKYVVGMNEEVVTEDTVYFNLLSGTAVTVYLAGLTMQTGGASGIYRVRVGGTIGNADGAVVCTLSTLNPTYALPPDVSMGASFSKPSGPQLVKLTVNASILGELARIRGFQVGFLSA